MLQSRYQRLMGRSRRSKPIELLSQSVKLAVSPETVQLRAICLIADQWRNGDCAADVALRLINAQASAMQPEPLQYKSEPTAPGFYYPAQTPAPVPKPIRIPSPNDIVIEQRGTNLFVHTPWIDATQAYVHEATGITGRRWVQRIRANIFPESAWPEVLVLLKKHFSGYLLTGDRGRYIL